VYQASTVARDQAIDYCKSQDEVDLFGGITGYYEGNVPSTDGGASTTRSCGATT
jgi:hypothetical protein